MEVSFRAEEIRQPNARCYPQRFQAANFWKASAARDSWGSGALNPL